MLFIGISRWFYLHFTLGANLVIQKMVQSLYKKLTPSLKNHILNLDNPRQAVEGSKSWKIDGLLLSKNAFLQLKHYIQKIYPTLISTN